MMAALARGDRHALARLIARFGPGIQRFAARALSNGADAEDVAQEVFLRAWRAAADYDPSRAAVSTWLYRIALRLCIDRNRRTGLRRFLGLEAAPEPAADLVATDRALAARQTLVQVQTAIAGLPDRQRQAILLRAIAELPTAGIAEVMQITPGAAEQLLVRARTTLRLRLGADFHTTGEMGP